MSSKSNTTWTCDRCGADETVPTYPGEYPKGWVRVHIAAYNKVGDHHHICKPCRESFATWMLTT